MENKYHNIENFEQLENEYMKQIDINKYKINFDYNSPIKKINQLEPLKLNNRNINNIYSYDKKNELNRNLNINNNYYDEKKEKELEKIKARQKQNEYKRILEEQIREKKMREKIEREKKIKEDL